MNMSMYTFRPNKNCAGHCYNSRSMSKLFHPSPDFQKNAHIKSFNEYRELWEKADQDPDAFWDNLAQKNITWIEKYKTVLNAENAPFYSWFEGGKLNASEQCIDRHLSEHGDQTAIIWEAESGDTKKITYNELYKTVNKFSNLLVNDLAIKSGDRVVVYLPMIPEAIYAMLACARIGAIHVVVFGGFSAEVLQERISDTDAAAVITADGAFRRGKPYLLKPIVDKALSDIPAKNCNKVLVVRHNDEKIIMKKGRDFDYGTLIEKQSDKFEPIPMNSDDTLFILHTSGSTGKPKGIKHSTAGYMLWAEYTTRLVFDIKDGDVFWCTADIGWITGHTYGVYGPLAAGTTIVMYEGTPTHPDAGRWWNIIEKHKVTQFYTAPTAIRMLKKLGPNEPKKYDLSSLKVIGTVGEPIDPEAWLWYYEHVGGSRCPVVDTWWQTETGGHIITPLPGATPLKPGSATLPLPGIKAEILDINGEPVSSGQKGYLCITRPWPSMLCSVWQNDKRYRESYFGLINSPDKKHIYFSGDEAIYDENGYITITGRADDVMNISGHRVGSAEIESAVTTHEMIAEIAIVGLPDNITGERAFAYIVLKDSETTVDDQQMISEINLIVAEKIGPVIKVNEFMIVPGLPKTRSGKILRRVLRTIAIGEKPTQDLSTIEDPEIVQKIQRLFHLPKPQIKN